MKKIKQLRLFLLCLCMHGFISSSDFSLDDPFAFDFDDAHLLHVGHAAKVPNRATFSADIAPLIFDRSLIDISAIVADEFYLRTNPIRRRSLHSLDFLQFPYSHNHFSTHLHGYLLYNLTYASPYWKKRTSLSNYVDMEQTHLIQALDNELFDGVDIPDIPTVLSLFKDIKAQQHQLVYMFQYKHSYGDVHWTVQVPLVYQLNTFFLDSSERQAIADNPLFDYEGPVYPFLKAHLFSDKLGIGDFYFSLERILKENDRYTWSIGAETTLPSTVNLKKGLLGSYFDKRKEPFRLDLDDDLLEHAFEGNPQLMIQQGIDFGEAVLDRLTAVVNEHDLGNNKHYTLSFLNRTNIQLFDAIEMESKLRVEFVMPGSEYRFIRQPITEAEIDAILALPDAAEADARYKIDQLNEKLTQKFFPIAYRTCVSPGTILQSNTKFTYVRGVWKFFAGSDAWYQTKESIKDVEATATQLGELDLVNATRDYALQTNMFIGCYKERNSDWDLGCVISVGSLSHGIGNNISLALQSSYKF